MAISKVDSTPYSVPPNTKSSGAVNNRGTVARGGSVASGKLTNVGVSRYNTGVFASTVIDNGWADKAVAEGTFAYSDKDGVAMRTTSTIGGLSNRALLAGANVPSLVKSIHSIHRIRTTRTSTAFRAGYWNIFTGQYTTTPTTDVDRFWRADGDFNRDGITNSSDTTFQQNPSNTWDADDAASVTRTNPGTLTYKLGVQPVSARYSTKTT